MNYGMNAGAFCQKSFSRRLVMDFVLKHFKWLLLVLKCWLLCGFSLFIIMLFHRLHWKRFSCRIHSTSVRILVVVFRGVRSLRRFTGLHHAKRIWIFETPIIARQTQPGHKTSPRVEISSDYVVRLDVKEARRMRGSLLLEVEAEERGANAASTLQHKHAQCQQLQALLLTQSDE